MRPARPDPFVPFAEGAFPTPSGKCELRSETLAREGHSVLLSVQDASPRLPRPAVPGPAHERGRGLLIVDRLSSGWGVETTDDLKAVWAHFDTGRTMAPEW